VLTRDPSLSLCGLFHPMGYPLEIRSNSREILHQAERLWQRYPVISNAEPLRLSVYVNGARAVLPHNPPPPSIHKHLFTIDHGTHDFAKADLSTGTAYVSVSENAASDWRYFRYHFLEPLACVLLGARHFVYVHASCIARDGRAVVLCGDSGAGKTCLAYACAKRAWSFVSGDAVQIVRGRKDRMVVGRPYEIRFRDSARAIFPELKSFPPEIRANGKTDLEIDTSDLEIAVESQSFASHLVLIQRGKVNRIEKLDPAHAMRELSATICYGDDRTRCEQRETLAHFLQIPLWRLRYTDHAHAEHLLRWLLPVHRHAEIAV
jgi:hypothetical protein